MIFRSGLLVISLAAVAVAAAADLALLDDARLTGELEGMSDDGTITLISPISKEPLKVRSEMVLRVDFDVTGEPAKVPNQRIRLINGDVLPANISFLNESTMGVSSPYLGKLEIPRALVDSIQLGIFPETVIYRGPEDFAEWKKEPESSRAWTIDSGDLLATGQGTISRNFELPAKFLIRFDLAWDSDPNIRLTFADPLKSAGKRVDRYFLQFASAGLEIKRESAGKNRFTPVVLVNRRPEEFTDGQMKVEIRVDRTRGRMQLYLDDELQGGYTDPIADIPTGTGISLTSQAPAESGLRVGNIVVAQWDDRGDRHRTEDRGNISEDSMIEHRGDRYGGRLISIRDAEDGKVFRFKSDFQEQPVEMLEADVSTVFFASSTDPKATEEFDGLVLHLRGGGEIRIAGCQFSGEKIEVRHPLLGVMQLDRSGVTMLERRTIPKSKPIGK